ncbi:MAG: thioesterase family protein [Gemmatimonadota bacterium]|nr:thioesterase family protein [Gemmatimonadota bacterium]
MIEPSPPRAELDAYPIVVDVPIRWGDMDAFGHVNNTVFFRLFEVARIAFFDAVDFRGHAGVGPILASTSCRFRRPLGYPDTVRVGVRAADIQEDRFTHEYLIVSRTQDAVAATGEGVIVAYDYGRAEKAPLPPDLRARIRELT